MARSTRILALLIAAVAIVVGCSTTPVPTSVVSATLGPATPSPSIEAGARLNVRFSGKIGCATFPYSCQATLSILPPDTPVAGDWRSPSSDPRWSPDRAKSLYSADHLDPTPVGELPMVPIGRHRVVVSLVGSYDTPSFKPDGSVATDLLSRCIGDVEVGSGTDIVTVRVTFTPDPLSFRATCTLTLS